MATIANDFVPYCTAIRGLNNGRACMGLVHDWYAPKHGADYWPTWHRIENCDNRNPYEAPGRGIFWVHERRGAGSYRAVVDDFGQLVRVPHWLE